jgi:hypothetical protein
MTALEELKSSARDSIKDQKRARERSRNPFFWLAWIAESIVEMFIQIVGWIAEIPVRLLSRIFRLDQEKVARSWFGRLVSGLFGGVCALIAAVAGLFYVLEFLGSKDVVLHRLGLK